MPELPEVETIATNLRHGKDEQPSLMGLKISAVHVLWKRTLVEPTPEEFERRAVGQVINSIGRRGKYLVIGLSRDTLLIHLRMSGDLIVESIVSDIAKHHRLLFDFITGKRLAFNDTRKFGRVWLTANPNPILDKLGPEPLDERYTAYEFHQQLLAVRRRLKPILMDQSFMAGLGNIYTDEALHMARLHPLELSNKLSAQQAERLLDSIRFVLLAAIERNGTSIDWIYRGGDYQNHLHVYGRTGNSCPECNQPIQRIIVGQRSTHLCPNCQVLLK